MFNIYVADKWNKGLFKKKWLTGFLPNSNYQQFHK